MLVAHRRRALTTFCLAGMQMCWFTPFVILLVPAAWTLSPLVAFATLLAVLLAWLLLLDALNRLRVASPTYELSVVGLLVLSTLASIRLLMYDRLPATDLHWLGASVSTLFDLSDGAVPLIVLILANVILWQRAASFTTGEVTFFGVGLSFRMGILLLLFGAALLHALERSDPTPLVWVYFGLGLVAVSLARIEDKSSGASSVGTPLPGTRLGQLLLTAGLTVALGAALAQVFTRSSLIAVVGWLGPVWRVLGDILSVVFRVLWWLLTPVMIALEWVLRRLAESGALAGLDDLIKMLAGQGDRLPEQTDQPAAFQVPPWAWTALRYVAVALVLLLLIGFVLLYLERLRGSRLRQEAEEEEAEPISLGGGILGSALARLRELVGLTRRYGVGRQLLAAVSVQNIYANLSRLARLRGYPRRPAQPPDDYLPALAQAFPGQSEALARLTAAYMRVHYGDRPVTLGELASLRADYHRIRRAKPDKEKPTVAPG